MAIRSNSAIFDQVTSKSSVSKTLSWKAVALAGGLGLGMLSHPLHAAPASGGDTVQGLDVLHTQTITDHNSITVQNGEKSASITFARATGGIAQVAIEHLDFFGNAYVTMVTASGPTRDDAAMAVATLQTFTNLNQQTLFASSDSITLCYNQTKPSYVISELERAKLISPLEAQAARTAFDVLQSRINPTRQRSQGDNAHSRNTF